MNVFALTLLSTILILEFFVAAPQSSHEAEDYFSICKDLNKIYKDSVAKYTKTKINGEVKI
ncbi:hypothetical protein PB01_07195 [Psychrobacillus glaciei]|uniref:Uncharacterized protein n=1 Tax=Psychrobacillus glaciei TaxID=2283160 RepID=A0A5J6SPG2_9BACI|nr:hypothetical protein PB01_07195 [Psychrobacillus glaciei]